MHFPQMVSVFCIAFHYLMRVGKRMEYRMITTLSIRTKIATRGMSRIHGIGFHRRIVPIRVLAYLLTPVKGKPPTGAKRKSLSIHY